MRRTIAAIDIGTTKVSALLAAADGVTARILGAGIVPAQGMDKGTISDLPAVTDSIARAVREAERTSGYRVDRAFVSVGGSHVVSRNARGEAQVSHPLRGVEQDDVDRALAEARTMSLPPERQVLHVIPRGFQLDGDVLVRDPVGMSAYRLQADVHIVTILASAARNVTLAANGAGVEISGLILQALASGEAVLTESERDMGVALVDIGGGTTDVAVYLNGGIWHTATIATGGNHITNDLAIGLHCPFEVAEDIKLRFGRVRFSETNAENRTADFPRSGEMVRVAGFAGGGGRDIPREEVVAIIEARAEEILSLVLRELKRSSYDGLLSAGVVLCGGTANLPGLSSLGSEVLGMPARVVTPGRAEGLTEIVNNTAQATGVGLVLLGMRLPATADDGSGLSIWRKMGRLLRGVLPGQVASGR